MNPFNLGRRLIGLFRLMNFYQTRGQYPNDAVEQDQARVGVVYRAISDPDEIRRRVADLQTVVSGLEERIDNGDRLITLMRADDIVVSFGWMTDRPSMWVSELGASLRPRRTYILYDFYTPARFQRNGHYSLLLKSAALSRSGETGLIYALRTNVASNGAIRKIGFVPISAWRLLLAGRFSMRR